MVLYIFTKEKIMRIMQIIVGVLLFSIGILSIGYISIWLCFFGGFSDIIDGSKIIESSTIKLVMYHTVLIFFGILKILFGGFFIDISKILFLGPGLEIIRKH